MRNIKTLGALKKSGYQPRSIKDELRSNLIERLKNKETIFKGIIGFDDTVLPDIERALLSRHSMLFLGLRGQAKTRMARLLVQLLDEWMPIVAGSEMNDDPLAPISMQARDVIEEHGDNTPIEWVHRDERYVEKLATPDVSVADLIGDVDPIKAATLKLPYSDERVIHFGLVPRSHRSIFVINELPDLQARIQVSLFNILEEGDIQIRGFKLRMPLDIQFIFTANPEDYTNRGSIITPLKDRIESQILTHYPKTIEIAQQITELEADIAEDQQKSVHVPEIMKMLLEQVGQEARESEFIDEKSGVSARMSISGYENLVSTAERRMLINGEESTSTRITDMWGVIPAITGKVELVYEGEQEGPYMVALNLIGAAIKDRFDQHFPNPEHVKTSDDGDIYGAIRAFFGDGNTIELFNDIDDKAFAKAMDEVPGIKRLIDKLKFDKKDQPFMKELVLHGLAEYNVISKMFIDGKLVFRDELADMLDNDLLSDFE